MTETWNRSPQWPGLARDSTINKVTDQRPLCTNKRWREQSRCWMTLTVVMEATEETLYGFHNQLAPLAAAMHTLEGQNTHRPPGLPPQGRAGPEHPQSQLL